MAKIIDFPNHYEEERRKNEAYQKMLIDQLMTQVFQAPQQAVAKANEGVTGE